MALQIISKTTADAWIPEIWAQEILTRLRANIVLARIVRRDYSNQVAQRGDTVNIPVPVTLSAFDVGDTGTQNVTLTTKQVVLNKFKHVPIRVDDLALAQSAPNLMEDLTAAAAQALAEAIENDLFALYTAASANVGTAGTDVSAATIRAAKKVLDDAKAPQTDRYLIVSPKDHIALMGDSSLAVFFAQASPEAIRQGILPNLYGFSVAMSQLVPVVTGTPSTTYNLAMHRDALALVTRPLPAPMDGTPSVVVTDDEAGLSFRLTLRYDVLTKAHTISVDVLYGVAAIRPELLVQVRA